MNSDFRRNLARLCTLIIVIVLGIIGIVGIAIFCTDDACAQTIDPPSASLCLYRPETVATQNPLGRPVVAQGRAYGYLQPVDALTYVRSIHRASDGFLRQEAASVAIQYSITEASIRGAIQASAWLGERSEFPQRNQTLGRLLNAYLMASNPSQRTYYGYILTEVLASRENDRCN